MSSFAPSTYRGPVGVSMALCGRRDLLHQEDSPRSARSSPHRGDRHDQEDDDEVQFVLSVAGTPVGEEPPRLNTFKPSRLASSCNLAGSWASFDSRTSKTSKDSRDSKVSFDDLHSSVSSDIANNSDSDMERTRPIAIEVPLKRSAGSQRLSTPTAPLSARGDLPGGYFPDHEDRNRVHRTHPFHADTKEARRKSIARACVECSPEHAACSHGQDYLSHVSSTSVATGSSFKATGSSSKATGSGLLGVMAAKSQPASVDSHSSSPSIASYNPTGAEDNLLPMGKYYPTNWENRKRAKRAKLEALALEQQNAQRSAGSGSREASQDGYFPKQDGPQTSSVSSSQAITATTSVASKAENPSVARAKAPPFKGHSRSDSEAKRRLQQYQRDMINQAAMAATRVLGSQIQQQGAENVMEALNQLPTLQHLQLPASRGPRAGQLGASPTSASSTVGCYMTAEHLHMISKPTSPRLLPLGSPGGPMTPMDLSSASEDKNIDAAGRTRVTMSVTTAPPRERRLPSQNSFPFGNQNL